jgi:hypothetical protein
MYKPKLKPFAVRIATIRIGEINSRVEAGSYTDSKKLIRKCHFHADKPTSRLTSMSQPTINEFFSRSLTPAEKVRKKAREDQRHRALVEESKTAKADKAIISYRAQQLRSYSVSTVMIN